MSRDRTAPVRPYHPPWHHDNGIVTRAYCITFIIMHYDHHSMENPAARKNDDRTKNGARRGNHAARRPRAGPLRQGRRGGGSAARGPPPGAKRGHPRGTPDRSDPADTPEIGTADHGRAGGADRRQHRGSL